MTDNNKVDYSAPLKKVKGMGSAHHGVDHWIKQKITAIANIPLIFWLVYSIISHQGATHAEFTEWLAKPWNSILMILLVISVLVHAKLGTQVIVEDYVSNEGLRFVKLLLQKIAYVALGVACIFSILKIAFTAGM